MLSHLGNALRPSLAQIEKINFAANNYDLELTLLKIVMVHRRLVK